METKAAIVALAALAQETRLGIFRRLVRAGPAGLPAGRIGEELGQAPATLSFHLKELTRAGLLVARQEGRFIYYAAQFPTMNALVNYLTENCCGDADCAMPADCC
jgi:ArsR family transcriptional regulator, arsenate/arsenite/antimonite-responsive transcriptional repressor